MWFFKKNAVNPLTQLNKDLQKLCGHINAGSGNYCASMQVYHAPEMAGKALAETAAAALGTTCRIQSHTISKIEELIQNFLSAAMYKGDESVYPSDYAATIKGEKFIREIAAQLSSMFANSEFIFEIYLNEGHPFYPVFWDFTYLVEVPPDAYLFVASSSD